MLAELNDRPVRSAGPIGERIREARRVKGWTEATLARELRMTRTTISRWERGKSEPRRRSLLALARALDRPPEWFRPSEWFRPPPLMPAQPSARLEAVARRVARVLAELSEAARHAG
jgi:transcriptional regulator with XRE-family HTH domain